MRSVKMCPFKNNNNNGKLHSAAIYKYIKYRWVKIFMLRRASDKEKR